MTAQDLDAVWDAVADVVVLGIGAAGAAAAIAARDAGATVLILEKMDEALAGGNTRLSGGIWFHNADVEQAALYLRSLCGGHPVPEPVIRTWAEETFSNTEWMRSLGAPVGRFQNYQPEYPELSGSSSYGGYLGIDGKLGDGHLYEFLIAAVRHRGGELHFGTPAVDLIQDPVSRRVQGVLARRHGEPWRVRARRGVVIATGGFEADPRMVSDYLGLDQPARWGTPAATGDGHRMALKAGADLWHMSNMMAVTGLSVPGFEAGFAALGLPAIKGHIFVGPDGTRFVDETIHMRHGHALVHGRYELYPTERTHVILDARGMREGPLVAPRQAFPVGWNALVEDYDWSADNSVEVAKGWLCQAGSVEELAIQLGIDTLRLSDTVARYNRWCQEGRDQQFDRNPATLIPLEEPPFFGFTSGPMIAWTNGGPRRDARSQVVDVGGSPIPGLYAAGTVSSTYSWCKDGGFHIADALAFGRVAGRNVAADMV